MNSVDRHRVDLAFMKEQEQGSQKRQQVSLEFAHLNPRPSSLHRTFAASLRDAQYWSFFDGTGSSKRMNRSLRLAAHAGAAIFNAGSTEEKSIQIWLDNPLEVPAFKPRAFTGPGVWLHSFYAAIACQEYALADQLATLPPDFLMIRAGNCFYAWAQTLQAFWDGEEVSKYLDAMFEMIDNQQRIPKDVVDLLLLPQIHLCRALLTGDPNIFNNELANTLQDHRTFFYTPANKHDPLGFLCLPAIAFAALAYRAGMPLTTTSGYLLQHQITQPQVQTEPE